MPIIEFEWQTYRFFPYEQVLARREVEALLGATAEPTSRGLVAKVPRVSKELLQRLTYFREIRIDGRPAVVPVQGLLEASARETAFNGSHGAFAPVLTRQSTRYSAHGLHEYRGKFHPQIVRVVGNLARLRKGAWVFDPFCGSGTTLLESAHSGWNAFGMDLNPLGVLISNAKLESLRVPLEVLLSEAEELTSGLRELTDRLDFVQPFPPNVERRLLRAASPTLPNAEYLQRWFPQSVLLQLALVRLGIQKLGDRRVRELALLVLSDQLRDASYQDPGDLRIRRRKDARGNYPLVPAFIRAFAQTTETIARARGVLGEVDGFQQAVLCDSREGAPHEALPAAARERGFDCVITSPPYATALPYLDTQRLSLAFLGLLTPAEIRRAEQLLIGSREIAARERALEELDLEERTHALPEAVVEMCTAAKRLVEANHCGFRRRNVPALLLRYFRDMGQTLSAILPAVRAGGTFALVVGANRTTLGGRELNIDTPRLLALVAQKAGWAVDELIPLETYSRFDIHSKNSIRSETLVLLHRPKGAGARRRPSVSSQRRLAIEPADRSVPEVLHTGSQ